MSRHRYEIVPYRAEHYLDVTDHAYSWSELPGCPPRLEVALTYERRGPAFTGLVDGEVLGCAGLTIIWPGLAEAWAVLSPFVEQHAKFVHGTIRRVFPMLVRELHLRRVQASVIEDYEVGRRWAERLGFREEGRMPKFGPRGETFIRYVLLPDQEGRNHA